MQASKELVEEMTRYASTELNELMGLPPEYDQTKGNRCDWLTYQVGQALAQLGVELRRELHQDDDGNWHYVLAHEGLAAQPTDEDLLSSLNPWQWREYGGSILHMPRSEMTQALKEAGAPPHYVALHSLATITRAHDTNLNPFTRQ